MKTNVLIKVKKSTMQVKYLLIALCLVQLNLYSQEWIQMGADIDGETANDQLGSSVSLSSDGQTVAISAQYGNGDGSGYVRVYHWNGSSWQQMGTDIDGEAAGDRSGFSISLSSNGQIIAIGAIRNSDSGYEAGHVRVYQWNGAAWLQMGTDIDGEMAYDWSGYSVSLSSNGHTLAIGAPWNDGVTTHSGHVRVYHWNGVTWLQLGSDIDAEAGGDESGHSVSLSSNGQILAIGAVYNDGNGNIAGHVRVYRWNGLIWQQLGADIDGEAAGDCSGNAVSLSSNGQILAIGAYFNDGNGTEAGQVRVYHWNGASWLQMGVDIDGEAAGDHTGYSVSLSSNGQILAIGAPRNAAKGTWTGHVRVFQWNGTNWQQLAHDIDGEAAGDQLGFSVSLSSDGQILASGAIRNEENGSNAGHVRVYALKYKTDTIPWLEDFNCHADGTTKDEGTTSWTSKRDQGISQVEDGKFIVSSTGSEAFWKSGEIDISSVDAVDIYLTIKSSGPLNGTYKKEDFLKVSYIVDGNENLVVYKKSDFNNNHPKQFSKRGITGNVLQLVIKAKTSGENDSYFWDNIQIVESMKEKGKFTDNRDYREYKWLKIGGQVWMGENLKAKLYNDKTPIPLIEDRYEWSNRTIPAYCWYNNDEAANKEIFGALYNWPVVNTGKLCPVGWHVPSNKEWELLVNYLGGYGVAGGKLKETGLQYWQYPNGGASNETSFNGLGSGYRYHSGIFNGRYVSEYFWTSTPYNSDQAWYSHLYYWDGRVRRYYSPISYGLSIRCLKDNNTEGEIIWLEDFTGLPNGLTQDNGNTAWSLENTNGECYVRNEQFLFKEPGQQRVWKSEYIDISSVPYVNITADVYSAWNLENNDNISILYKINNGPEKPIESKEGRVRKTISGLGFTGDSIQIIVKARVDEEDESYLIDNISVSTGVLLQYENKQQMKSTLSEKQNTNSINSIEKLKNHQLIKLYPNPTFGILNINNTNEIEQIEVYNYMGQLLKQINPVINVIDMNEFSPGLYIIKIKLSNGEISNHSIEKL